jgi:hypothetical protein
MTQILGFLSRSLARFQLPAHVKAEIRKDHAGLPATDPGADAVVKACTAWLVRAQDLSASADGGVARDYNLVNGWATSYPETTGYIVPTVIEVAKRTGDAALMQRARRMLDWLAAIQYPEGGIQGGKIDAQPRVPVTFNTGQVLIGFAAGVREFGDVYRDPMNRAASWLRDTLDTDGCWRKHATPFAQPGEKAYETHVSWGLFEAAKLSPDQGFGEAGLKQVRWAMQKQQHNGWFAQCCLDEPATPLTHTLGYVLRGIVEAANFSKDQAMIDSAILLATALLKVQESDGRLAGRYDSQWRPTVSWACLTGICQIASSWFDIYKWTNNRAFYEAGCKANSYVRRTIALTGNPDYCGGVKGAFPVDGEYGDLQFLNWAAKFCIDSNLYEIDLRNA